MLTFEIRYGTFRRDASLRAGFHYFDVRCLGTEARFAVEFPDSLGREWGIEGRANAGEIQRRAVLGYLKEHLAGIDTLTRDSARLVLLTAGEPPKFSDEWAVCQVPKDCPYERKECKHRRTHEAGPVCAVAHDRDPMHGITTLAACERCGLPSTDILCDNLVYVKTVGAETDQTGLRKRSLVDAQCNIGSEEFGKPARDAKLCVPRGRSCWVQSYQPEEAAVGVEPGERDLAAEALDMVDTLNTIFRDQFDAELFRLKQFRTGRVLMGPCATEDGFAHKLQVLGDLIDLMNSKELGEAQGVTSEPGSVNWLAAFLERVGQGDPAPVIRTLRDIRTLRKQLAAHSAAADDFVEACGRLGIDLPIRDWQDAWRRILSPFLEALRKLQALLP
jgi:hypothetical protein